MKHCTALCLAALTLIMNYSCSKSASDEFDDANGIDFNATNLITKIIIASLQDAAENETIIVSYDANNRVSSVSDGESSGVLVYSNGDLSSVTGTGDTFNIEELLSSPYDAFETGFVDAYDSKGNPTLITFYEEVYNDNTGFSDTAEYTADIIYDDTPNPYFYTLQAAGMIDLLDDVDLNFSLNPQIPEIVQARMLFPVNNISRIVYKDNNSVVLYEIDADYVYNNANHPTTATVTGTSLPDNEISIFTLVYAYKN